MFTWICPQCGREVPPSYTECPTCAERRQQAGQPAAPPPAAPPEPQRAVPAPPTAPPAPPPQQQYAPPQQPQYAPPPQQPQYAPPPQQPQYAPPQQPYHAPQEQHVYTIAEQKKGMPSWLAGVLTVAVLGGGLFGLYKFVGGSKPAPPAKAAIADDGKAHPYKKYIEITGVRLLESADKKPLVRFAVINHSEADLSGLELSVVLTPTDGGEPVAVIDAKVGSVPAQGVKDMESPIVTKLKFYELPDWQFVKATFEITAPGR